MLRGICERRVVFARNVSMDGKELLLSRLEMEIISEKRGTVLAKSTTILSPA